MEHNKLSTEVQRQAFEAELTGELASIGIDEHVAKAHIAQFWTGSGYSTHELQSRWEAHLANVAGEKSEPAATAAGCPDDEAQSELYLTINELKALGRFAGRGDVRGWVNHICIVIKDRTCRILATDGRTMMTKVLGFAMDGHHQIFIPRNIAKIAKELRPDAAVQSLRLAKGSAGWTIHFGDGHFLALPARDEWTISDIDRVIREATSDDGAEGSAWFNASYLGRIGRAAELLAGRNCGYLCTHGADRAATVDIGQGYLALVMPIKGEPERRAGRRSKK